MLRRNATPACFGLSVPGKAIRVNVELERSHLYDTSRQYGVWRNLQRNGCNVHMYRVEWSGTNRPGSIVVPRRTTLDIYAATAIL